MDFREIMLSPAYDFLRTHKRLGSHIMLLGIGGSHAYGTNIPGSDVDFRGVAFQSPSDLLGLTSFEQFMEHETDTVIFAFNKMMRFLLDGNPSAIELLGLEEDQYLILNPLGKELLENRRKILSKKVIYTFGGYAETHLRRLENGLSRNRSSQPEQEENMLKSVKQSLEDFNRKHASSDMGSIRLYVDKAVKPGLEQEVFMDVSCTHYPLRDYIDLWSPMKSVVNNFEYFSKAGKKKDDGHLNKLAMHAVRALMTAIDIVENGDITTRCTKDLSLLMAIRAGEYMQEDGSYSKEYYEIVKDYKRKLEEAAKHTSLPNKQDVDWVAAFMEKVNRMVVMGEL